MRVLLRSLAAAVAAVWLAAPAMAADYPARDIDLVVPYKPGGAVDTTSRILAESAKRVLKGHEITVVNKDGGGGVVGQAFVSKARPNGYTILAFTNSAVSNPLLKGAPFAVSDFTPIGLYTLDPEVIAVPAASPYKTIAEFMAAAKAGNLKIVSSGSGTSHHMAGLALELGSGVTFTYVFVRGFGEEMQAMIGNHVDGAFWPFGIAKQQAASGAIRILAIASEEPMPGFETVPTWKAANLGVESWQTFRGWAAPKGTPKAVIDRLSGLLKTIDGDPAYRSKMEKAGYPLVYRDSAGFAKIVAEEDAVIRRLIKEKGLKPKK
ncbi:MAG: tripartite tricarboxylate transporter substrate binding protein [Rhodospirillaceae bacterium]